MEKELISYLSNILKKNFIEKIANINEAVDNFLNANISEVNKMAALEQLYLFQLYSSAYIGPDPRAKSNILSSYSLVLNVKDDKDLLENLSKFKTIIDVMKNAETHPLETFKRKLEDDRNSENLIF